MFLTETSMFKSFVYLLQNNQINLQDKINRKVIQKKKKRLTANFVLSIEISE